MTALEYLRFCGEITGMGSVEIKSRSEELLKLVGLEGERHRVRGFSRGMKQRLGIAQALLNRPKLLICDEPTSALDPVGRKEILSILQEVKEQTTVLFSTHILSDVERICTDIAFLKDGKIAVQGKLSEVKGQNRTEEYVLETICEKDTKKLLSFFPQMLQKGQNLLTFSGREELLFQVLGFLTEHKIPVLKVERQEPTLESMFMEVLEG